MVSPTAERSIPQASSPDGDRLLQRVIFPRPGEPADVRSLYLIESHDNARRAHAPTRTSVSVGGDADTSFQTYFNAFPASYWRRWTTLREVTLRVQVRGLCRVDLYRSKIDGARIGMGGALVELDSAGIGVIELTTDLGPFEDGGWIWFDLTTTEDVEILSAGWYATEAPPRADKRIAVGIPTFNRPADAVATLRALAGDALVDEVIDAIIMPDQGTREVKDEPGFAEAAAAFGDRFRLIKQGNLGGSGGYSRIMIEALATTDAPYILYMDDDTSIEPDSILRALAFARYAKTPTLVGGQMLNLQERSHLHTMGEALLRDVWMWGAAPFSDYDHDFAEYPLSDKENAKNLHRRIDVDFNGWWTFLIPREVAEEIGQPLPLFIKWDDVEFGLRAAKAGYRTVSVPGIAVWHMAWSDKDDAIDWQAYFHLRNRLIVAAIHRDGPPTAMLTNSLKAVVKHSLALEYSTIAIQIEAIRDVLAGPEGLWDLLPSALPKVAAMRREYPDAVVLPSATELPTTTGEATALGVNAPKNPVAKAISLAAAIRNNLRPADPRHHEVPQANYPPIEARWFSLGRVDGATVTTADGRGVVYRKRDREKVKALAAESLRLHGELRRRWPELQERYRAAHAELTSRERWQRVFDEQ